MAKNKNKDKPKDQENIEDRPDLDNLPLESEEKDLKEDAKPEMIQPAKEEKAKPLKVAKAAKEKYEKKGDEKIVYSNINLKWKDGSELEKGEMCSISKECYKVLSEDKRHKAKPFWKEAK